MSARKRPSAAGWVLMVLLAYPALHVVLAVLGIPPGVFFPVLFRSIGFGIGCVIFLGLCYQLVRR